MRPPMRHLIARGVLLGSVLTACSDRDPTGPGPIAGPDVAPVSLAAAAASDGKILFTRDFSHNGEIYVMDADGSNKVNLSNNAANDGNATWSPDMTRLAFTSNRDGNYEIYVMNADGSNPTRLTTNAAIDDQPDWSPDGAKIVFASTRDGNYEVYVMNADGTGQTRLTNDPAEDYFADWSPDGSKLAFASKRTGDFDIYTMNADGSNVTLFANRSLQDLEPAWSPDGTRIAWTSVSDGDFDILVKDVGGTQITDLTHTSNAINDQSATWSPDGTRIAFMSNREGALFQIFVMDASETAEATNLSNNAGNPEEGYAVWSSAPPPSNTGPTADAGGPYAGTEGAAVSFDGTGSGDPEGDALGYAWDFGDGASGSGATPSHSYADNGSYVVTLTVSDGRDGSDSKTTSATIGNAAPVVNAGADGSATTGTSFAFSGTFSDAGAADGPWSYTIDWGDGSAATTGSATGQSAPIGASHTYASAGTYALELAVTDKDHDTGRDSRQVAVTNGGGGTNRAPTARTGGPYAGTEGGSVSFNGTGSSDPDGDALGFTWNFGDGSTGTGATPTHRYVDDGKYTVTLTVTDGRGKSGKASTTVKIADARPVVQLSAAGPTTIHAGKQLSVVGRFTDAGTRDAPWTYAFWWGDGAVTKARTSTQNTPIPAGHKYTRRGTYTVRLLVMDKDRVIGASGGVVVHVK